MVRSSYHTTNFSGDIIARSTAAGCTSFESLGRSMTGTTRHHRLLVGRARAPLFLRVKAFGNSNSAGLTASLREAQATNLINSLSLSLSVIGKLEDQPIALPDHFTGSRMATVSKGVLRPVLGERRRSAGHSARLRQGARSSVAYAACKGTTLGKP